MDTSGSNSIFATEQRREATTDVVVNRIKELLIAGKLRPGDLLPNENDLARDMNVSRGSLREAMKILSALGIVEIRRGDGTYITNGLGGRCFDPVLFSLLCQSSDMDNIIELREMVEFEIVRLIIRHTLPADIDELDRILAELAGLVSCGKLTEEMIFDHELRFHGAMGKASHNPLVAQIYDFLMEFFRPRIKESASFAGTEEGRTTLRLHRAILEAIKENNTAKAQDAVSASLSAWGNASVI